MTKRREFVENRPTWEQEYGQWTGRLGHIGGQVSLMAHRVPALLSESLTVLDMGCAYGHYLRFLQLMNPRLQLHGVELSRHAAEGAEQLAAGARVFWQAAHEPIALADESVDVVYCFDMIEHIADADELHRMMAEIRRLLKPGGVLFLETPNYSRRMQLLYKITGQGHWLKYDHTNLFNDWKLRQLVEPHLRLEHIHHRESFNTGPRVPLVKGLYSEKHRISGFILAQAVKA